MEIEGCESGCEGGRTGERREEGSVSSVASEEGWRAGDVVVGGCCCCGVMGEGVCFRVRGRSEAMVRGVDVT